MASSAKTKNQVTDIAAPKTGHGALPMIFAAAFGALLGLSLLKFGDPVLMEYMVDRPANGWEWVMGGPWPVVIGYWMLAGVAVLGLLVANWKVAAPKVLVWLPLAWFLWEVIAGTQSEFVRLSSPTIVHFLTCMVCFYLGLFSLSRVERLWPFWLGIIVGFALVLQFGFQQRFGGLQDTQHYWLLYVYPNLKQVPPGLYKKMVSPRIFATLMYPNTLAGVILMLLPVTLAFFWSCKRRFTVGARGLLMGIAAVAALACLYWSGSRSGWLLTLLLGVVTAMCLPIQRRTKIIILAAVLVLGLAGFFVKNAGYFKKGATSVEARFDYWNGALKTTARKPIFGTGPGTFAKAYERIKKPESEMARLTHNDYLEQASDSGLPGFVLFAAMVFGIMGYTWVNLGNALKTLKGETPSLPRSGGEGGGTCRAATPGSQREPFHQAGEKNAPLSGSLPARPSREEREEGQSRVVLRSNCWIRLAVWLGLLGWALQSFTEFGLYIPAIAWPAFAFLGWLLGRSGNPFDSIPKTG